MTNSRLVPFLLASCIVVCSCGTARHTGKSSASLPGTWQQQPIVIDGDNKDWPSPYPNYDSKAMVAYATSNDAKNLYITMETGDLLTQIKILKQGMTVSIDTGGHKEVGFKINYPMQSDNDLLETLKDGSGLRNDSHTRQLDQKLQKTAKESYQFSLDGFTDCMGGMATQKIPCGVKVIVRMDEYKELVWEAVVPFKAILNKDSITTADAGKPISICFAIKGFKAPGAKNAENAGGMNNSMSGGNATGNMGRNSGMGRGGGSTRNATDNPMQQLYESTKTWKQFGLSYH